MRIKDEAGATGADDEAARLRCEVTALKRELTRLRRTVRQQAQRQAETEARFRVTADAAPMMLWMADPDGRCTFVNATWLRFTGRSLEAEQGLGWQENIHPDDRARCLAIYREAMAEKRAFESECRLRHVDGAYHWVESKCVPLLTPEGEFQGYVGVVVDMEEPRRLLEELRRRTADLQRANARMHELDQLKTGFMSAVSHELRTPLTSIQGFAEFLEDDVAGQLNPAQRDFVAHIMDGALRLRGMVDDLLDFTQLNAGTLTLVQQEIDLGPVIDEVADQIRPNSRLKGLSLTRTRPDAAMVVWADEGRMRQVLANLLSNAVKFTPEGGRVCLQAAIEEQEVRIEVKDTGIGIGPEHLQHLFERFYQVDSSYTRVNGGAGLGLSLSKALVEAHGGRMGCISEPGKGSTFWFTLPLSRPVVSAASELRITLMPEQDVADYSEHGL